jgi:hypothetical protein
MQLIVNQQAKEDGTHAAAVQQLQGGYNNSKMGLMQQQYNNSRWLSCIEC